MSQKISLSPLTKSGANGLKGFACMMIVIHHYVHLSGVWKNPLGYVVAAHFGYIFVSLFFFLSGFGVAESEAKHRLQLFDYLRQRVGKLFFLYSVIVSLNIALYSWLGIIPVNVHDWLLYLCGVKSIDPVGWYVWVSLLLYCFAWVAFRFKHKWQVGAAVFMLSIGYMLVGRYVFALPDNLYMSVLAFGLGVMSSLYRQQVYALLTGRGYFGWYCLYVVGSVGCFYVLHRMNCQILKTIIASWVILPLALKCALSGGVDARVWTALGAVSFEVYMVHMKVFVVMGKYAVQQRSIWVFVLLVVVAAFGLHQFLGLVKWLARQVILGLRGLVGKGSVGQFS